MEFLFGWVSLCLLLCSLCFFFGSFSSIWLFVLPHLLYFCLFIIFDSCLCYNKREKEWVWICMKEEVESFWEKWGKGNHSKNILYKKYQKTKIDNLSVDRHVVWQYFLAIMKRVVMKMNFKYIYSRIESFNTVSNALFLL